MCKVIAIANQKGGVGKTTTTVNLGIGLARKGKRVVLIDADPQGSMTVSLGIDEPDKIEYSLANVLMDVVNEEEIDYAKIILKHEENIDFIPANIELAGLEVSMVNVMSRELVMKRFISNIKENYDYILIDCMPSLGMIMGTTVTLTAGAAPSGKVFDKWEVVSGGITLADANSATTTFTMPASAVSVKATYKNAPHTHTYNQETVKPEALKTPADCTSNAVYFKSCSCGAISTTDTFVAMNTALGHAYGSDWKYDSTNHWHECSRCHDKKDEAAHDYGSDNVCDTCGYYKTVPHTHNLTLVAAKAATCTEGGKEAYYKCEGCGKFYEDVLGTKEITDLASWGNIAKIAHTTKQTVTKATPTANGKIVNYCSVCKKTLSTTVIPKASSIKLKATSLTYNGKVRTPKVIVKDRTGKTLVKNTDYTVSYAKGRKYVGKYAVKITFKGKYSGTKTLYFTIKPKATSISSLKAGSKKFTVKWKKQATQTTGYQVQVATNKKFKKNKKTVTIKKQKTTKTTVKKLKAKKKYYVRVCTYKTVKINGKSIRIYSGWSKTKTVTTKK